VIRVLIAVSSALARAGLESLLKKSDHIELAGSVTAFEHIADQDPDVIVADWNKPAQDLAEDLSEELRERRAAVVLLTGDPTAALELLRSGVRAVLPRDASPDQIIAGIEAAAAGLVVMRPEDLEPRSSKTSEPLTSRENEVLGMMAEGLANKEIAHRLGISEHTVKFHITSIMSKLNASSRTEAVMLGLRQGLILL